MDSTLSFFADENISSFLIKWIRENGYSISGVKEENMCGTTDVSIIHKCFKSNEIILTHDNDFGKIIFTNTIPFYSIIYLRPGHFDAGFHIPTREKYFKEKGINTKRDIDYRT